MTEEEKSLSNINSEDYNTMRAILSEIELKLMGVDAKTQFEFYAPIKRIIYEAWQDACNPDDDFLYRKQTTT